MLKPSNPQGTRDFLPDVVQKRDYILDKIKNIFQHYGFTPIETPALENLSTLTGKYGEEGDKLLFKVLNSGDIASSINLQDVENKDNNSLINSLSKRGLRYDLTVPFARFVVQHQSELTFPFRRYQVQPVWRADRPQKGRFREFTQCDADAIGSDSLLNEADLVNIYAAVFDSLGLGKAILKINHRRLIEAVVEYLALPIEFAKFTIILDKLDKIGEEGVGNELNKLGVAEQKIQQLFELIRIKPFEENTLAKFEETLGKTESGALAISELNELLSFLDIDKLAFVKLDLSLARGLDYYTGCIFEAVVPDSGMGSISGGGRYANLTEVFGLKGMSGVGISFGIDRLYEILETQNLFPSESDDALSLLFCHFDAETRKHAYQLAQKCRANSVSTSVYPDLKKLNKQMEYANKMGAKHVIVVGQSEIETGQYGLKNMNTGESIKGDIRMIIQNLTDGKI